jgi:hypothetical protein
MNIVKNTLMIDTSIIIQFSSFIFNSINPYWLPKPTDIEHITYVYIGFGTQNMSHYSCSNEKSIKLYIIQ